MRLCCCCKKIDVVDVVVVVGLASCCFLIAQLIVKTYDILTMYRVGHASAPKMFILPKTRVPVLELKEYLQSRPRIYP